MTNSTFYHDGFRDGQAGNPPAAPDGIYGQEYMAGYREGLEASDGNAEAQV